MRPSPTPSEIKLARESAGMTQDQAARVVWTTQRTWARYESGDRAMHRGLWELFLLKTYQPARFDA